MKHNAINYDKNYAENLNHYNNCGNINLYYLYNLKQWGDPNQVICYVNPQIYICRRRKPVCCFIVIEVHFFFPSSLQEFHTTLAATIEYPRTFTHLYSKVAYMHTSTKE